MDPGAAKPPLGSGGGFAFQLKTKDNKDDKKRAEELHRMDDAEKKKNQNAPFL